MADPRRIAVLHAAPGGAVGERWGDTPFAASLADALGRAGRPAVALDRTGWDEAGPDDLVVVLRGLRAYRPRPTQQAILWVISHSEAVTDAELEAYDHVCVASSPLAEQFRGRTSTPVHVLHQATDVHVFTPPRVEPTPGTSGVIVVANGRWPTRRAPMWLRQLGQPHLLYGGNWDATPEAGSRALPFVPNARLPALYASAAVVVADQWDRMAHDGFVANRLFDIGACGGFVLSDGGPGMDAVFGDLVPTYDSRDELRDQLERWLGDAPARRARSRELMAFVRRHHSFDHRAADLLALLD